MASSYILKIQVHTGSFVESRLRIDTMTPSSNILDLQTFTPKRIKRLKWPNGERFIQWDSKMVSPALSDSGAAL